MMAEDLDDGEFWLPPQFLSEDEDEFKKTNFKSGFGSSGPNSDLSSPVESVLGSNETESDEDELLTELTRKLAYSTYLSNDVWKPSYDLGVEKTNKIWNMATSPQSTLSNAMKVGFDEKQGSSRGSPSCLSPPAAMSRHTPALDLLHAAAEEVARMRRIEDVFAGGYCHSSENFWTPNKTSHISVENENLGFYSNQGVSYHHLQANNFQQQQKQHMAKRQDGFVPNLQQAQQTGQNRVRNGRPLGLSPSAWPTLQQSQSHKQPNSGMRTVFLGHPVAKRECSGTGVFLPRQVGTPTTTRKNPGCSTVLLPERVVQALNLKLEAMDAPPQLGQNGVFHDYSNDAALKYRNKVLLAQAQQRLNISRSPPAANNEVRLPQEWTY